jgi:hypothetical protein
MRFGGRRLFLYAFAMDDYYVPKDRTAYVTGLLAHITALPAVPLSELTLTPEEKGEFAALENQLADQRDSTIPAAETSRQAGRSP